MSTLKVDALEGETTEGSITIQGEGTATTNLQQSLSKAWVNFEGTSTNFSSAIRDSHNITSVTDDATGRSTVTIANDMSNANYCATAGGCFDITQADDTQARQGPAVNNFATGSFRTHCGSNTTAHDDWNVVTAQVSGDLA